MGEFIFCEFWAGIKIGSATIIIIRKQFVTIILFKKVSY